MKFLKWLIIGPYGVFCVEDSHKMSFPELLVRFFTGAVKNRPQGPTIKEVEDLTKLRRVIKRRKCKVCGVYFWSWRVRPVCHKWSCYKEV